MEKHFIIGTAGHVDHGKTMLVKALTGKDTDRLKEEKERGISIELGFAPLRLPNGTLAGIVDVPGHEKFIKNMLAGVGGMDLVLLVIAADEGIMPQTTEHLDIINLLQVPKGIIVVTKIDLVDEDWVDLVEEEIKEQVQGTVFEGSPIIRVSSATKEGMPELLKCIEGIAEEMESRKTGGWPRMAIDRVFTITGFGTVVTGTLLEGTLRVGDSLQVLPKELETKVRTIQVHGEKVNEALAGQRVALNLAGLELEQVGRGDVLSWPNRLKASHRLDVKMHLLSSVERPLANRARVRIHLGTSEVLGRIVLLDREDMEPGDIAYVQLECEEPLVAAKKDRFVIRSYSPMHTIGGGMVVDPVPTKHKRFRPEVLENLAIQEKGTTEELIVQALEAADHQPIPLSSLVQSTGLEEKELQNKLAHLLKEGKVHLVLAEKREYYVAEENFRLWGRELVGNLKAYHEKFPLRQGIPKEEIRSRLFSGINNKLYNGLLQLFEQDNTLAVIGENLALGGYKPELSPKQLSEYDRLLKLFREGGFQTPSWDEAAAGKADSEEVLNYFVGQNLLIKLEDNILLHKEVFEEGKNKVIEYLKENGEITLAEARDLLNSSRKYVLPFLNRLDKEKVTRRIEDKRVLF